MNEIPTTGLRSLPLSQYLLRGRRSNAAAQYEELRRLQEEQGALTPMSCGPFRLFVFEEQEAMLRSVGKDRRRIVTSLNEGIDVVQVEAAESGNAGTLVGLIDKGKLHIEIMHKPEPPALADWSMLSVKRWRTQKVPFARLIAVWSVGSKKGSEIVVGDANESMRQCRGIHENYLTWAKPQKLPVVSPPFLILHPNRNILRNESVDSLFDGLRVGTPLFVCRSSMHERKSGAGNSQLILHAPEFGAMLTLEWLRTQVVGPNEWLINYLDDAPGRSCADCPPQCFLRHFHSRYP